jgi:hypothetical protein
MPPAVPVVLFSLFIATVIIPAVVPGMITIRVRTSPVIIAYLLIIVSCRPFIFVIPPPGR